MQTPKPMTDSDGTTYTAWSNGYAIGFEVTFKEPTKPKEYIYLNPSTDTDGNPDVFVYQGPNGDPAYDSAQHFYDIGTDWSEWSHTQRQPTPCDECGNQIPDTDSGSIINKHHAPNCSLYDPNEN